MPTLAKAGRVAEWKIMANTSEIMGQWKNVLGFCGKSWQIPLKIICLRVITRFVSTGDIPWEFKINIPSMLELHYEHHLPSDLSQREVPMLPSRSVRCFSHPRNICHWGTIIPHHPVRPIRKQWKSSHLNTWRHFLHFFSTFYHK